MYSEGTYTALGMQLHYKRHEKYVHEVHVFKRGFVHLRF